MIVRIEAKAKCRRHSHLFVNVVVPDDCPPGVVVDRVRIMLTEMRSRSDVEHTDGKTDCRDDYPTTAAGSLMTRRRTPCFDCFALCVGCDGGGP